MKTAALTSAALRLTMMPNPENHIAWFREQYVAGQIDLVELEKRVERALQGFYYEATNDYQIFA